MKINAYYHLFETAHTGLLDEPVNLVPDSWNRFTVTDGDWMSSATLSALCYRDLFLAQQIQIVDKDKREHYKAGDWITINSATYTISFNPTQYDYEFKNGLNCNVDYNYVTLPIPDTFIATDGRPPEYKVNRIEIKDDGLYYGFTSGENYSATVSSEIHFVPSESAGIVNAPGAVTIFPERANVVFVSAATLETFDEYYEYQSKQYHTDNWSANTVEYREDGRCVSGWNEIISAHSISSNSISSNIFNPTDTNTFNAVTGEVNPSLEGGLNYICGDVNMVPSGVLFIYNNSSYYYKDVNGIEHTNELNPLSAYSAYRNENYEIVSSRIYFYQGTNQLF